jgi:hypothetical protein
VSEEIISMMMMAKEERSALVVDSGNAILPRHASRTVDYHRQSQLVRTGRHAVRRATTPAGWKLVTTRESTAKETIIASIADINLAQRSESKSIQSSTSMLIINATGNRPGGAGGRAPATCGVKVRVFDMEGRG